MTFANRRIPVPLVKRFIKQTLFALDYLHRECGIIHSDLKPHNMMLALIDDHDVIVSELEVAPTEFSPAKHDNDPCNERKATVKSQPLLSSAIMADEIDVDIKLGDFGHANWVERHLRDEIQPIALRAPETVLGYPYSTPADIWSVGCLTFEYLSGVCLIPLRDPNTPDTVTILDTLLARILQTSSDSDYPTDMIDRSIDKDLFFTAEGALTLNFHQVKQPI
ncbi:hypothetical protein FRB90_007992 [Tulasnella sp. 427]|nr:hypothetical protein FRB90_007992 [Tulasnella sp. 427]